jgi:ATP-dependent helicase HrpB
MSSTLPIDSVLPDLLAALRGGTRALLIAPPGAGKTTRVAPALLHELWCDGQVLLLVPRRLAARAAAEYIAREHGEAAGATFGYATRLDSKVGKATRLIAMTHGLFLTRLQADPELNGVSAVLFDEVHERSLDSDLGLALALDAAAGASTRPAHPRHVGERLMESVSGACWADPAADRKRGPKPPRSP